MKRTFVSCAALAAMLTNSAAQLYSIRHNFSVADAQIPNPIIVSEGRIYGTTLGPANGTCFAVNEDGSQFRVLHSFSAASDGGFPKAGVLRVADTLFGTTSLGGTAGEGTIFSTGVDGSSYLLLKSFAAGIWAGNYFTNEDGSSPQSALIISGSRLFGTASYGGHSSAGTVFSMLTNGTDFTVLHHFTRGADGANPYGGLVQVGERLYGTARDGGDNRNGTIFSLNPVGTEFSVLHAFSAGSYCYEYSKLTNADGSAPTGALISDGAYLYGVAPYGGLFGNGTVFKLRPDGTEFSVIKHFPADAGSGGGVQPNPDGSMPQGALLLVGDRLYGTAYGGGTEGFGTVYTLKPDGSEFSVLHNFTPATDGYCLTPGLVVSGNTFFGATGCGGASQQGIIFGLSLVPRFVSATAINGGLSLTCNVIPGRRHAIQYATDPTCGRWQDLEGPFSATNSILQTFYLFGPEAQRYYRIEMLP